MRGFSLVEAMVAMLVTSVVMGAVASLVAPARQALVAQPEAADVSQRARALMDTFTTDLLMAGAGSGLAGDSLPAAGAAAVVPYRLGAERSDPRAGVHFTSDTLTVLFVPPGPEDVRPIRVGARTVSVVSRTYYLKPSADRQTGQLMRYDGLATDSPVLDDVVSLAFEYFGDPSPPSLVAEVLGVAVLPRATYGPTPPAVGVDDPADGWGPGENCTFLVRDGLHEPRLASLSPLPVLGPLTRAELSDGPWCDGTSADEPFDADLFRLRRVRIRARLQATSPFRGPAGRLFSRGGTARAGVGVVPDREVVVDVVPRNLAHGW